MILETLRATTDWLNNATKGFNALIVTLPVDAGDEGLRKTAAFINDQTRDDRVAITSDPPNTPALYVVSDGPVGAEGEVKTIYRDADHVAVAIRYIINNADDAEANAQVLYALRAIMRSIRELMRNENIAARTRNSVVIESCQSATFGRVEESAGAAVAAGAVVVVFKVRDKSP